MQNPKLKSGFTLIELLIVVAIIGVLASLAVPAYRAYINNAHGAQAMSQIKGLVVVMQSCAYDNIACDVINNEVANNPQLITNPSPITENTSPTLSYDNSKCMVEVTMNAAGSLDYLATSTGAGITDMECQQGAGL